MKSSQPNFNLRLPGSYLTLSYLIATVKKIVILPGGNSVTKITLLFSYLHTYFKIRPLAVQIYPLDVKSFSYFDIFIKTPSQIESKIQLNFKGQLILSYLQQYKQNWCYFQIFRSTQMFIHLNQSFRQKRTCYLLLK